MSTLDINIIRDYLIKVGCKIEYPILVHAFKQHLYNPDPNVQGNIRTQFKDYVNRLATVSLENNMKFIILRPEFRPKDLQMVPDHSLNYVKTPKLTDQTNRQPTPVQPPEAKLQKQPAVTSSPQTLKVVSQNPPPPLPPLLQPQSQAQYHPNQLPQHQRQPNLIQRQQQQSTPLPQVVANPHQSTPMSVNQVQQYQLQQQTQYQQQYQLQQLKQQQYQQQQQQSTPRLSLKQEIPTLVQQQQQQQMIISAATDSKARDIPDSSQQKMLPPPPPPPVTRRSQSIQRPGSLNLSIDSSASEQTPPPRPPPRRRQSTASLFKPSPKPVEKSLEIHDLAKRSPGRVKEHALKLNSFTSFNDLNALIPIRSSTMKENRLSREPTISSATSSYLQRNGSHISTSRPRSSHREDESDSSSLQPIDPLRRKWAIEACNCNYNGLLTLLRDDPKIASYKDIVNGYTALHWAAKFGNLDIIKLIAGTHGVSTNIKSSAGYTPLHVAYIFGRCEAADLLLRSYKANPNIRDHSGKRPMQYRQQKLQLQQITISAK